MLTSNITCLKHEYQDVSRSNLHCVLRRHTFKINVIEKIAFFWRLLQESYSNMLNVIPDPLVLS